jgi:hypothetical protein
MTPKQYGKILKKSMDVKEKIEELDKNTHMHLKQLTDGCYIRFLTAEEFDAHTGEHYDEQISLVLRDSNIELWKGDVRIHLTGETGDTSLQLLVDTL